MPDVGIQTVPGVAPGTGGFGTPSQPGAQGLATAAAPGITGAWGINIRDRAFQRVHELEDLESLEMVFRFNDVGTWVMRLHAGSPAAPYLLEPGAGIVVTRGGTTVFSGPVDKPKRISSGDQDALEISGYDDLIWIRDRVAHPVPTASAPPYNTQAYDTRTGIASTILRQYVDINAGPSAIAPRRVPGLTLAADPLVGASLTGEARWQGLLEHIQEIATTAGNLGFRCRQSGNGLLFSAYQVADRSQTIRFSEDLGNLLGHEYEVSRPAGNYVFGLGTGEGTARTVQEGQDAASIAERGRIEVAKDHRNSPTGLGDRIRVDLAELTGDAKLAVSPLDLFQMSFLEHYELGDHVSAVIDGETISEVIRDVKVTINAQMTVDVQPNIGTPKRRDILRLFEELRALRRRITELERR